MSTVPHLQRIGITVIPGGLELYLYEALGLPSGVLAATFFQFLPNTFPFPPNPRPEYNPNNNHDSGASSHPWSLAMYATDS